jgi:hypothetical protein
MFIQLSSHFGCHLPIEITQLMFFIRHDVMETGYSTVNPPAEFLDHPLAFGAFAETPYFRAASLTLQELV